MLVVVAKVVAGKEGKCLGIVVRASAMRIIIPCGRFSVGEVSAEVKELKCAQDVG